jgi:hypothetical protein
MQVFPSIYACGRAPLHSSGTYKKELKDISEPLGRIRQFRVRLEGDWRRGASPELRAQLKQDLQQLISDIAPKFKAAQNVNKTKVKDLLAKIEQSLIDDYGVTPRAKSVQLQAAETNLAVRGRESNRKNSYRTRDAGALEATINQWQGVFDEFSSHLRSMKQHVRARPAFGGARYSSAQKEQDKKHLTRELTLAVGAFEKMHARPFSTFVKKLIEARAGLAGAIESGQISQVERVLIKMDLVCRMQKAQAAFETIKRLTLENSGVTVSDLKEVAVVLEQTLPEAPTFGKKTYRNLLSKYDKLRADAKTIRERLDEYETKPLTLSEREQMAQRLRAYAKSFDLEGHVRSIQ